MAQKYYNSAETAKILEEHRRRQGDAESAANCTATATAPIGNSRSKTSTDGQTRPAAARREETSGDVLLSEVSLGQSAWAPRAR